MSKYTEIYKDTVISLLQEIEEQEQEAINRAADLMAETIKKDQLIHVIGPGGHSNIGAYEMFYRAGGLVPVNAILDPGTLLSMGARRSTIIERTPEYGRAVLEAFDVDDGVLIIVNAYGINAMCIDVALEARRRGVPTIGITSRAFAEKVPPDHPARHPSKKNLFEVVDVHVDCHMPFGDAVVSIEGLQQKVAPVSTLVNCFTLNLLVIRTVEKLLAQGIIPPVWVSANVPGGDEANKNYIEKYKGRIRLL
ncbi:MAG: SIS domain-containing protein [Methanomassiliicoccales archaeon]|nr:SIS domain-containing protein [Methanomassiliicoccales archaeon]